MVTGHSLVGYFCTRFYKNTLRSLAGDGVYYIYLLGDSELTSSVPSIPPSTPVSTSLVSLFIMLFSTSLDIPVFLPSVNLLPIKYGLLNKTRKSTDI